MKIIIIFFLALLIFPLVNADILSINSGGSTNIVINPDTYIEGFFGCVPTTCAKLGYNCNSWNDGCAKTLNCGSCGAGFTCTSGLCTAVPPVTPPGGGGPGGGGPGAVTPTCNIVAVPSNINFDLKVETNKPQIIKVTNNGKTKVTINPVQTQNKDEYHLIFAPESFSLESGETKNLEVTFVALNKTGIFTGKIKIGCAEILSALNVKTVLLLFDSNIIVLNRDYKVSQGSELKTKVNLIPMGDKERLDVTLNYVIKNYAGKVYLTQSETVLVENAMDFKRNFGTGMLPLGDYIVGLELVYPGGTAPSSAHFEVVPRSIEDIFGLILFCLVVGILIIAILIIILLIKRRRKKENNNA